MARDRDAHDNERMLARFQRQLRHLTSREEELRRKQAAKAARAARQRRPRSRDWSEDEEPAPLEKIVRRRPTKVASTPPPDLPRATVTAVHASGIDLDGVRARMGTALLLDPGGRPVVGDEVAVDRSADVPRAVALLPRRTWLARPDPGNPHRELVVAANVDVAVIVASVQDPPLRPGLIDRCLVALRRGGVGPLLCANKIDLLDQEGRGALTRVLAPYLALGVAFAGCSATSGEGIDALRVLLRGRTAVFLGHSGVGKTSLLNALDPEGGRRVGAVRAGDGKGRHTTTASTMRALGDGTRVIDTPGIRAFGLDDLEPEELRAAFPEFTPFAARCRFTDCSHTREPACAVREAAADGTVDAARYASYLRILATDEG
jgi:ribosome biogenesis GTPase